MDETDDDADESQGTASNQRSTRPGQFEPGNPYRFAPGVSGNPDGRPKGITRVARELLEEIQPNDPERRTKLRLLYESMLSDALPRNEVRVVGEGADARTVTIRRRGSYQHARELLDRAVGRVPLAFKMADEEDAESFTELSVRVVTRGEVEEMRALSAKSASGNGSGNGNGGVPE